MDDTRLTSEGLIWDCVRHPSLIPHVEFPEDECSPGGLLPNVDIVFAIIREHDFKSEGTETMHFLLQKPQSLSAARYISQFFLEAPKPI